MFSHYIIGLNDARPLPRTNYHRTIIFISIVIRNTFYFYVFYVSNPQTISSIPTYSAAGFFLINVKIIFKQKPDNFEEKFGNPTVFILSVFLCDDFGKRILGNIRKSNSSSKIII